MDPQIGDIFDHFQISGQIARGGMATIYRARDLTNNEEVALKIPDRMLIGDPAQYERFQRELDVTNTLQHPAIQRGVGAGQFNRTPYLATALVEGQSLREFLDQRAPLPLETALNLIRKIGDGIAYCHESGVIHRDLKPENILVKTDGQPVILDFGLALTKKAQRVTYANLSSTAGTPDYMAPEQIEGHRGDVRTDLYALGTMLYEMLAGQVPFSGDSPMAIMAQHLQGALPRLDRERPEVSPHIAAIVAHAMQRSPDDRYATVRDFLAALEHPETEDLAILNTHTGPVTAVPFWRSRTVLTVAAIFLALAIIFVLAYVARPQ